MSQSRRFCPHCQRRYHDAVDACPIDLVPLHVDPFIGSEIGRWKLIDFLGQGAMGVVYAAVPAPSAEPETSPGAGAPLGPRHAAVKILNAHRAALQPDLVRRFEIEARAASRLENMHVARVFDWGTTNDGHLYLAMERLRGAPMDRILSRAGHLGADIAATMGYQIAQALAEAHDKQIVHRDLKPGNVFVEPLPDGGWHVRVLDFGVARMTLTGVERTRTGIVAGTPAYMSPEQLRGVRDLDGRSDIYSLGVLLYRALAGSNPFQGDGSFAQAHERHLNALPPPLPERVPAALSGLVLRLLGKARADRPQSMYEVQAMLLATGLIDVNAGGTAFDMDAETVAGAMAARSDDPTTPDESPLPMEDLTRPEVPDTVVARPTPRRETTQVSIAGVPALDPPALDPPPTEPRVQSPLPAFTDTLDLPPLGERSHWRLAAMFLLFGGCAIGAGLGIGLQYGLGQGGAEAASATPPPAAAPSPRLSVATSAPSSGVGAGRTSEDGSGPDHEGGSGSGPVGDPAAPGGSGAAVERTAPAERVAAGRAASPSEVAVGAAGPRAVAPPARSPEVTEAPAERRPAEVAEAPEAPAARLAEAADRPTVRVEAPQTPAEVAARKPPPAQPARRADPAPVARRTTRPTPASDAPVSGYQALLDASLAAMSDNRLDDAIRYVESAARLRPDSAIPPQRLCDLYARAGRHEKALYSCRDWLGREPKAAYRVQIQRRIDTLLDRLNR